MQTESGDSIDWINYHGELEYSNKMTEKLSKQVKHLKIEKFNLEEELDDKQKIISILNQRISELTNPKKMGLEGMLNQYNEMMSFSKDRGNRINTKLNGSFVSLGFEELKEQV